MRVLTRVILETSRGRRSFWPDELEFLGLDAAADGATEKGFYKLVPGKILVPFLGVFLDVCFF